MFRCKRCKHHRCELQLRYNSALAEKHFLFSQSVLVYPLHCSALSLSTYPKTNGVSILTWHTTGSSRVACRGQSGRDSWLQSVTQSNPLFLLLGMPRSQHCWWKHSARQSLCRNADTFKALIEPNSQLETLFRSLLSISTLRDAHVYLKLPPVGASAHLVSMTMPQKTPWEERSGNCRLKFCTSAAAILLTLCFTVSWRMSRAVGRASPGPFCFKKALVYLHLLVTYYLIQQRDTTVYRPRIIIKRLGKYPGLLHFRWFT